MRRFTITERSSLEYLNPSTYCHIQIMHLDDIFQHSANKIHYEVFDNIGDVHLREADQNGYMKAGTSSNRKKISDIL
ncbi:hypothetical protein GCM10011511_19550 [Puia dinghuensis]|uniref:Uncharacterized protein n=1 Tax=Puia dinghuensis TaxID=1792502 RepID=A0A8J2XSL2_9BACT|nr:hypothetical protein GCM10011511_19550 [Puia dinghuensis]